MSQTTTDQINTLSNEITLLKKIITLQQAKLRELDERKVISKTKKLPTKDAAGKDLDYFSTYARGVHFPVVSGPPYYYNLTSLGLTDTLLYAFWAFAPPNSASTFKPFRPTDLSFINLTVGKRYRYKAFISYAFNSDLTTYYPNAALGWIASSLTNAQQATVTYSPSNIIRAGKFNPNQNWLEFDFIAPASGVVSLEFFSTECCLASSTTGGEAIRFFPRDSFATLYELNDSYNVEADSSTTAPQKNW